MASPEAKIATLRGDLAKGRRAIIYLPPNYTFPNHSHTSEELYVWIQGTLPISPPMGRRPH